MNVDEWEDLKSASIKPAREIKLMEVYSQTLKMQVFWRIPASMIGGLHAIYHSDLKPAKLKAVVLICFS